ncbi:MAG: alpha/beta fold hydrolase [Proteobacteria bacterium]|nr:alpha/beta fold hydrolase [Pseudomonadota bacterium]
MIAARFIPPRWLRGAHLQSLLSSSAARRRRGARALDRLGARSVEHILEVGGGVRLQGFHTTLPRDPRGLVLLLHGWEGSVESGYILHTAATLLAAGLDVFRLNFRDHGDTHRLNEDPFHSCRIDEVVGAAQVVSRMFPQQPFMAAGFSLGGNFALRLGLRAPAAGIDLRHVAAVCPALDPAAVLIALETGLPLYDGYFMRKWRASLRRKRAAFPQRHDFADAVLKQDMRALTAWMVGRYTDFPTLADYFDGYCIAGDRLAGLSVPASLLAAVDDPVIPIADFQRLQLPALAQLVIAAHGGHCGFLEGASLQGFAEKWVCARLSDAVAVRA